MIQKFVDWLLYAIFGLDPVASSSQVINFFLYDTLKIILLLFFMIFIIGFVRTYLPQKKVKKWLTGKKEGVGNFFAAIFGAITPFCSCSSIPIFLGFLEAGIPLGITFSFLIASPLINEYVVVIMLGFFGLKITALYVLSGLFIAIVLGVILGRMKLEKHLVKDLITKNNLLKEKIFKTIKQRVLFSINESTSILKKLWLWIIIAVGIAAAIHNYIPTETIHSIISKGGFLTVPLTVILGVPMYGSCAAIVPIALVLFQKGVPLGTALAFMMATSALSLPEAIILRRTMNLRLIAIFFGIVAASIAVIGYLFNFLQPLISF